MAHITKDKGDLAVAKAILHLLEHDIRVCMPLSEHLPFDLIAVMPDMTTLKRVQVKYRALENGFIPMSFRSNYYNSKRIYTVKVDLSQIDAYATYCPETDTTYYMRVDEIPQAAVAINLRVTPPRNGQKKGIWLAANHLDPYRISTYQQTVVFAERRLSNQEQIVITRTQCDLVRQGWYTCSPSYCATPFDLIAVSPDMMRLIRIRVGHGMTDTTPYTDAYALYDPADKTIRYLSGAQVAAADRCVGLDTHPGMSSHLDAALVG